MATRVPLTALMLFLFASTTFIVIAVRKAPGRQDTPTITPVPAHNIPGTTLRTEEDAAEVFRRAFWREPAADDRILQAERREWIAEGDDGVRRWQWFIALQPSPAFSAWLEDENPFSLSPVPSDSIDPADVDAPVWFPTASRLVACTVRQSHDRTMTLLTDSVTGTLYATDAGQGFRIAPMSSAAPSLPSGPPPTFSPPRP